MRPYFALIPAFCSAVACLPGSAANWAVASNHTTLTNRADASPTYFDTKEFKELVPFLDYSGHCAKGAETYVDFLIKPGVVPSPDLVKFRTCYDRPVEVREWKYALNDSCGPGEQYQVRSEWDVTNGSFDAPGKDKDVFQQIEISVCVTRPPDCRGEWINKPVWDYEWIVRVPNEVNNKYNKEGDCGATFLDAVNEACDPFQATLFNCNQFWYGTELRFRHNLLCGRTRIQNAIKKASNDEAEVHCPYFVEVPVPP